MVYIRNLMLLTSFGEIANQQIVKLSSDVILTRMVRFSFIAFPTVIRYTNAFFRMTHSVESLLEGRAFRVLTNQHLLN